MKTLKKIIKGFINLKNIIKFHFKNVKLGNDNHIYGKIFLRNKGQFIIGDNCTLKSGIYQNPVGTNHRLIIDVKNGGILTLGNNVGISNCVIICFENISLEDNVMVGSSVQIYDSDHHSLNLKKRLSEEDDDIKNKSVLLKNGCFIGANSIILKGVTVGENSIIGAGSVVTKDIPDNEIWAGNPAKFIRKL